MEHSEKMPVTPRFGISKDNNVLFEKGLGKTIPNCSKDIIQCNKNIEKFKNTKNEKSKPKNKEKNENISKEKIKNKSKEKSKAKHKSSKSKKKNNSTIILPFGKKFEQTPFDIFSEKFLHEKEQAFQQFQMNDYADFLGN